MAYSSVNCGTKAVINFASAIGLTLTYLGLCVPIEYILSCALLCSYWLHLYQRMAYGAATQSQAGYLSNRHRSYMHRYETHWFYCHLFMIHGIKTMTRQCGLCSKHSY